MEAIWKQWDTMDKERGPTLNQVWAHFPYVPVVGLRGPYFPFVGQLCQALFPLCEDSMAIPKRFSKVLEADMPCSAFVCTKASASTSYHAVAEAWPQGPQRAQ